MGLPHSKYFIIFLCLTGILLSTDVRSQGQILSYKSYNKPLKIVLKDLAALADANIIYSETRIPADKPIMIDAQNETLADILHVVLEKVDCIFQVIGGQIVVLRKSDDQAGQSIVYGYIKDRDSGEPLIGAEVITNDRLNGTITDENGYFRMKILNNTYRFTAKYLGYTPETKEYYISKDTLINFNLSTNNRLNEILILGTQAGNSSWAWRAIPNTSIPIQKIQSTHHLVGEADVFRYLSLLPGVSSAADGIGGLNIRGGSADQNLYLLDGVPVYNTGHALGLFSVFNTNAVRHIDFYKGYSPAKYTGRVSSVIDVITKEGNNKSLAGDVTLSTIGARATLEGPISKGKGSFIVSYRRTFLDVWIKELTKYQNNSNDAIGQSNYYFYDANAKLNYQLTHKLKLTLNYYKGGDNFMHNTQSDASRFLTFRDQSITWGNSVYSAKLFWLLTPRQTMTTTLYNTEYTFNNTRIDGFQSTNDTSIFVGQGRYYNSRIRERAVKQIYSAFVSKKWSLEAGWSFIQRRLTPFLDVQNRELSYIPDISDFFDKNQTDFDVDALSSQEMNVFFDNTFDWGNGVLLRMGFNQAYFYGLKGPKIWDYFQPRVLLSAQGRTTSFSLGVSKSQQFLHMLANSGFGLPTDLWIPSNENIRPQESWTVETTFGLKPAQWMDIGIEIYYTFFNRLTDFPIGGSTRLDSFPVFSGQLPTGEGVAYGAEIFIKNDFGRVLFDINYSFSESNRTFATINNGRTFPFQYNRRHNMKASIVYRISNFSEFLISGQLGTGNYFSMPSGYVVDFDGIPQIIYLEKNNAQYPIFTRVDVGLSFYNTYKWGRTKLFLGLYNAFNRKNPFYNEIVRDNENPERFEFLQYSLFPILPTISYGVAF